MWSILFRSSRECFWFLTYFFFLQINLRLNNKWATFQGYFSPLSAAPSQKNKLDYYVSRRNSRLYNEWISLNEPSCEMIKKTCQKSSPLTKPLDVAIFSIFSLFRYSAIIHNWLAVVTPCVIKANFTRYKYYEILWYIRDSLPNKDDSDLEILYKHGMIKRLIISFYAISLIKKRSNYLVFRSKNETKTRRKKKE
jgi:hypothetical protein